MPDRLIERFARPTNLLLSVNYGDNWTAVESSEDGTPAAYQEIATPAVNGR